jgi:acetylornithine deacetylase/succinyl-diaminopimelate desuccinylase-like protein
MDKYLKLSQKSLASLASSFNGRRHAMRRPPVRSTGLDGMFRDLIEMPTVSDDYDNLHIALDYIDDFLSERGMRIKRFEWNGVESMVAMTQNTKQPTVLLNAHLDVVPAPPELFTLREENGNYYGRGVYDMKFAIAAFLQVVEDLQDRLHEYDFGLMITNDEETGGFNGVVKLLEEGYRPKSVVIPDGGDDWNLETFCKGLWHITISAPGTGAHGSRPWEGDNAIHKLMTGLQEIRETFPRNGKQDSTLSIDVIKGGDVVNKVAASANAQLDIRTASLADDAAIKTNIKRICKKHGLVITEDVYSAPVINDPKNHYLKSFMQSIKKITGQEPGESMSYAATDGRHFAAANIPCVIVRPPGGNLHGPNEWIAKQGLHDLKDVLADFIEHEARLKK